MKGETDLYDAELVWKKATTLYNMLTSSSNMVDNKSLLAIAEEIWNAKAKILDMQQVDLQRNYVRYLCDLSAKLLPSRAITGRGRNKSYPRLWIEVFKLSIHSTDCTPCILITESVLSKIADTVAYVGCYDDAECHDAKPKKKKAKIGDTNTKLPVNKFDQIELAFHASELALRSKGVEVPPSRGGGETLRVH